MSQLSREEKVELLRKLRQKEALQKEKVLEKFEATKPQEKFLTSQAPIRIFTGGNGTGKTLSILIELVWTHLKVHPYRDCSDINHSWVIVPGYDKVEDYCAQLKLWCPPSQMPDFDKMGTASIRRLRWKNGDLTTFYSVDSDVNRFEGTNFQKLFIDEPCPRGIYIAALRGLRNAKNWSVVWAMTPISEPWIYEDLYLPSVAGEAKEIEFFQGSSYDNPYLSRDFLKAFESQLSEEEREIRIEGKFAVLQGRVFKDFNRKVHVLSAQTWPEHWPVYEAFDVHTRKPNTAIWVGLTKEDQLVVIDELEMEGIPEFAKAVLERRGNRRIISTIVDNSALAQDWSTKSAMNMLRDAGITDIRAVRPRDKDVSNGINKIKRLLNPASPRLFFLENCRKTIKGFEMYVWEDYRLPERNGLKEKPRKVYDDYIDPLRYIVNRDPRFELHVEPIRYNASGLYNKNLNSEERKIN